MNKQILIIDNDILSFIPISNTGKPSFIDVDYILALEAFEGYIKTNPKWLGNNDIDTYVYIHSSNLVNDLNNIEINLKEQLPNFSFAEMMDKVLQHDITFDTSHIDDMDLIEVEHNEFVSYRALATIELEKYTLCFEIYTPKIYEPYKDDEINIKEFINPLIAYYAKLQKEEIMKSIDKKSSNNVVSKCKI